MTKCPFSPAAYVNAVLMDRRFRKLLRQSDIALLHELAQWQGSWVVGGWGFPSELTLARRTGMSRNTIARSRKRLGKIGLLVAEKRPVRTGRLGWHYRLVHPKEIEQAVAAEPEAISAHDPTDGAQSTGGKAAHDPHDGAHSAKPGASAGPRCAGSAHYPLEPAFKEDCSALSDSGDEKKKMLSLAVPPRGLGGGRSAVVPEWAPVAPVSTPEGVRDLLLGGGAGPPAGAQSRPRRTPARMGCPSSSARGGARLSASAPGDDGLRGGFQVGDLVSWVDRLDGRRHEGWIERRGSRVFFCSPTVPNAVELRAIWRSLSPLGVPF